MVRIKQDDPSMQEPPAAEGEARRQQSELGQDYTSRVQVWDAENHPHHVSPVHMPFHKDGELTFIVSELLSRGINEAEAGVD
jgi:hypothetical protein